MAKAILILDEMPDECMECPLRFKDGDTDDWFRFRCHISKDQVKKGERLENCLLKPLPQKKDTYKTPEERKQRHEIRTEADLKPFLIYYACRGFNACIDEILKGEE